MRDHLLQTDKTGEHVADWLMREPGGTATAAASIWRSPSRVRRLGCTAIRTSGARLGSANGFSIREAREKASKLWQAARRGEDPIALLKRNGLPSRSRA